ncbi:MULTISPECIES: sensor histidine kinase [Pseudoclavibacter]|uniref:histidine kinase n=1 Tax=Pseudoclavibacter terrae TaxID=1530195 RepID=A0A7J5AYX3_9MICO|nr:MULTISPECIES: PAS domain-containing sensor histidine kinase [Pseudoclavibacter]KAB1636679.1 PAS domain-containing protein [Pseudoclavibacter terrae]NYF14155.1 two-component sensor histidine kinase [Pseudoclavibacter sp. JAI123]PPG31138.1 ATPase [Pseudoclavibacter sp. RFBB5]PPG41689.1 ATPase [Pseudoclavibacter sp. RFBA6]
MSSLSSQLQRRGTLSEAEQSWILQLSADWQLLTDLSCADVVLWVHTKDDDFVAVAQGRPSSAPTLFYRDLIGQSVREQWAMAVRRSYEEGITVRSTEPDWFDEIPTQLLVTPVFCRLPGEGVSQHPIAVITRHTNLGSTRSITRQEETFRDCADEIFAMIEEGAFPDPEAPQISRRGAPRASDGLIRLDRDGVVTFASANALSAMNKLGFGGELEGEVLSEVASALVHDKSRVTVDEALPLVVTGRAPWMTDVEARDITVTLRALPLRAHGERTGAIVLCRDTTDVRHQQQELITKDATIREIHHRVKNNLQTVAALLRIQARRSRSDEARESLTQAMRRVSSIAVVHDTLSGGFSQTVDFDEVFLRVMKLITEVSASSNTVVRPVVSGRFGTLPSEYATPLALALTELVTNSVEHGLAGQEGEVTVTAEQTPGGLSVTVADTGSGFVAGRIGAGLGTQIVRTLVEGELGGSIEWHSEPGEGTQVKLLIPSRWKRETGGA